MITDVSVSEDGTELTYEQGSFSVTGTIVSGGGDPGKRYIVLIQDESTGKYYAVQNAGSLVEVNSANGNTVTVEHPLIWTYTSAHDGLDSNANHYNSGDEHQNWEPYNIRVAVDARGYNGFNLPEGNYFR